MIAVGVSSISTRWRVALPGHWHVVRAQSREALMSVVHGSAPDLVLLYLGLPGLHSEDVSLLCDLCPGSRVLAFVDEPSECEAESLVRAGVHGYLPVTAMPHVVSKAVRVVLDGDLWVARRTLLHLIEELRDRSAIHSDCRQTALEQLSPREGEIAERVAAGDSNRAIAERLGITERTVKAHLTAIFAKTGVHDRMHLALMINGR